MKNLLLLFTSVVCFAQSATLAPVNTTTPPAAGYAPGAVIPINIVKAGNPTATALQFDVQSMAGVATVSWSVSPAIAGSKILTCSANGPATGTCALVGLNQTVIPDGVVAIGTVTLAPSVNVSPVVFSISNPIESDPNGASLAVSVANPTVSLSIAPSRCAVTGDGAVSSADLQAVVNQIVARTTSAATDLNTDGKTNVLDAQIVATAATTGVCNSK